ncbi:MAG: YicC/YloC family endoribonuclease [Bryobacteraceae bacterium]
MANPIRSMTGFARVRRTLPEGDLTISLRAVNHRGLDLQFHLPPDLDPTENAMRKAVSAHIARGHISIRAHFSRNPATLGSAVNKPLLQAWLDAFQQAKREFNLAGEPDLNVALRLPGMIGDANPDDLTGLESGVTGAIEEAIAALNAERAREGAATAAAVRGHVQRIAAARAKMVDLRSAVVPALQDRMQQRLGEMLQGAAIDPARLAQEAAILSDRSDISEELARLEIHTARLGELLAAGGEMGKKIEFLAQEMHRETNTVLSKSNAAGELGRGIAEHALAVKAEIEKIREQSLNLE